MESYLIVGSGLGIGNQIAGILQKQNKRVWGAGRENRENLPDFLCLDVTKPETFPSFQEPLRGLAYCPGSITLKPFKSLKDEDFLKDFEINVLGAFRIIRHFLPNLQASETSSIVLFSTVAVQMGLPYHASIASAKGAIEGLTRSLAAEFAPKIRVNGIAPSLTDTPLAGKLLDSDTKKKAAEDRHPLKSFGKPEDVASLAVWLLEDQSKFVTGQVWAVDGGMGSVKTN